MSDAALAARLLAADLRGLGGAWVRARPGPARDRWLATLRAALPEGVPWRRLPPGVPDAALLGGVDLAATLATGRRVSEAGLLAAAAGGVLVVPMAERLAPAAAALLAAAIDHGAGPAVIALDEGASSDEAAPVVLTDRLAFHLDLDAPDADPPPDAAGPPDAAAIETLVHLAARFGIDGVRAPLLALRVAREAGIAAATRLVLLPRATILPSPDAEPPPPPPPPPAEAPDDPPAPDPETLADLVLEATLAALPPGLLASLAEGARRRAASQGKAGARTASPRRGRPVGARAGDPRRARLNLLETIRAAAPWQRLRAALPGARIAIRRDDIRVSRFKARTGSTTIFAVDASGSQALARLAEAKGAVELLLADCYVRRDQVALVAFRGTTAELLLPPTGALARAKRALAGLPGGGATPLAAGIDAAAALAAEITRRGRAARVVLLTDGRANIARDGSASRAAAEADALAAARALAAQGTQAIVIDTSPRPSSAAAALAAAMRARAVALPFADAARVAAAVRA
jgi:magnesium chelatase subunit D